MSWALPFLTRVVARPAQAALPGPNNVQNVSLLSDSDNFSLSSPNGAAATFTGSIANGALHGYSQIMTGSSFDGNAYVGLDAYFYDNFHITGPSGQSGVFQISMNFDGSGVVTGGAALGDYVNNYDLLENGTVIPGIQYSGIIGTLSIPYGSANTHLTTTVNLTLAAGSTVLLGQMLQMRSVLQNEGTSGTLTLDDSNTGYFTVTPLTQGFGFSTASGFAYDGLTAVPEPSSFSILSTIMLAAFAPAVRRRFTR